MKKVIITLFVCLIATYGYANNKGGNSGNSNAGGNSGNSSSSNSGNNSSGNSSNSGKSNKSESKISSSNSSGKSNSNHGQKVSTYTKIAKSLGLKANVGTHLANFGTPEETGITELQNEINLLTALIETKPNEIETYKSLVSEFENELDGINTEINLLENQLTNVDLTEEEITDLKNQISDLEKQRDDVFDKIEVQETNIANAEEDLDNAIADLSSAEADLENTIQEVESKTGVTGWASINLDTNGDGKISHQEFDINGDGFVDDLNPFAWWNFGTGGLTANSSQTINDQFLSPEQFDAMALENVGTTTLDPSVTLIAADDTLENEVTTLYFDLVYETASEWTITNKLFYEEYDNLNENAYGFSQFHDSYVIEEKLIFGTTKEFNDLTASVQISPSIRFTDFAHADDWINEYFNRRDLTMPSGALDARLLATRIDDDYVEYYIGEYTDVAIGFMADLVWNNGLSVMFGARHDVIDMESMQPLDKLLLANGAQNPCVDGSCVDLQASDEVDGTSWTFSASYEIGDTGIIPYVTLSEQATVIAGQGAEITVSNIMSGEAFDTSELTEFGVKGQILKDKNLYFSLSFYEQERTDFSAQSTVTNQSVRTEGVEFELRWAVTDALFVGATYTDVEAINLNSLENGNRYSQYGIDDLPNIPPELHIGGVLGGPVNVDASGGRRAGMPENIFSVYGTYLFDNGLNVSASVADVDSVPSGFSNSITLPSYTLINASIGYETEQWSFTLTGKNLSDELYFRSNFPNLFGSMIVLPELPRHYVFKMEYRF